MRDFNKFKGCLIGGAIGDALGYAVEFLRASAIFKKYGENGITEYELLGKAVTDAKKKVTVLSKAAGVTLKDIQSIDYSWGQIDFEIHPMSKAPLSEDCLMSEISSNSCDLDIEPDDIEVSDTVTVIWEIQ